MPNLNYVGKMMKTNQSIIIMLIIIYLLKEINPEMTSSKSSWVEKLK